MTEIIDVTAATISTIGGLSHDAIRDLGRSLSAAHRVFIAGNGGSAAHASHCACDLAKLAGIDAWCVNDNLAGYSAGVNDEGQFWLSRALERHGFCGLDMLLLFSVGGGSVDPPVSLDLVRAAEWASCQDALVGAVVGRRGAIVEWCDDVVHIDCPVPELITPVVESIMPLVWHALVAGPLKREEPVWR